MLYGLGLVAVLGLALSWLRSRLFCVAVKRIQAAPEGKRLQEVICLHGQWQVRGSGVDRMQERKAGLNCCRPAAGWWTCAVTHSAPTPALQLTHHHILHRPRHCHCRGNGWSNAVKQPTECFGCWCGVLAQVEVMMRCLRCWDCDTGLLLQEGVAVADDILQVGGTVWLC
jgi:hypothetical protein